MLISLTRQAVRLARKLLQTTVRRTLGKTKNVVWELPYDAEATSLFLTSFYHSFTPEVMTQVMVFVSKSECYVVTCFDPTHWAAVEPMLNTVVGVNRCFNIPASYLLSHALNDNSVLACGVAPNRIAIGEAYAVAHDACGQ